MAHKLRDLRLLAQWEDTDRSKGQTIHVPYKGEMQAAERLRARGFVVRTGSLRYMMTSEGRQAVDSLLSVLNGE